jgi:hypothetical protein
MKGGSKQQQTGRNHGKARESMETLWKIMDMNIPPHINRSP